MIPFWVDSMDSQQHTTSGGGWNDWASHCACFKAGIDCAFAMLLDILAHSEVVHANEFLDKLYTVKDMRTILYSIILYLQKFSSHFTSPGFFRPCQLANLKDERIQDKGNVLSFAKKWISSRIIVGHLYALFDGCASCHPFRRFFKWYRYGFNVSGRFWKMLHGVDFHRLKIGMLIHSANSQVYLEPGPANDAGWSAWSSHSS